MSVARPKARPALITATLVYDNILYHIFTNSRCLPEAFYRAPDMTVCDRDHLPGMAAVECLF